MPLELHEALTAIVLSIHAMHLTMGQSPIFGRPLSEYDAGQIQTAIKKVGKLKRHNGDYTPTS
jgi:hypothetical protein